LGCGIVARISLHPSQETLIGFFQLTGHKAEVASLDVVALALTHAIAQLVGLRVIFRRQARLVEVEISRAQRGVGAGEVSIEFDRKPVVWKRIGTALGALGSSGLRKGLQSFQRGGSRLLQRLIEFLD
jgi:hypothetical protein